MAEIKRIAHWVCVEGLLVIKSGVIDGHSVTLHCG